MSIGTDLLMQGLAKMVDRKLNGDGANDRLSDRSKRENGFVLLVFPFDMTEGARTNYVSNGDRKDVLTALKEIVARFEGQPEVCGNA